MSEAHASTNDSVQAELDWQARRKKWEEAGVVVPVRTTGVKIDWEALRFLPFTEQEVSRMLVELRRSGRL
ncbi:hypothetical protein [Longimicrobium terrae]|uniref:Uncharacterized protein n=1 Tax=Longimicrobium terrae TaxID=1639882 RepID=A0A841H6W0_9BACT|nr:hypothetical protein [Longimicrobium terrae]MBB4638177.1 hypothetical protein [Longimicrobium terrae]MBB6073664.1 hypothetical protein [Longimicrobium terrae]NNC30342.1 hypothetical protein [Longimicrobium terrae]